MTFTTPTLIVAMNLKKQLRSLLSAHDMTASQLSKKSSVPKQSLSDWLSGSNPRDIKQIKRVADVFGVTVDNLIFGDGPDKDAEKLAELDVLLGDQWIGGTFEVKFRRVKK